MSYCRADEINLIYKLKAWQRESSSSRYFADPGGSGPALAAGTRGDTAGLPVPAGCLAGVGAEVEDVDGLASEGGEGAKAVVRNSVLSESDGPLPESTGTEPLLVDAGEIRRRGDTITRKEEDHPLIPENLPF